ncbi:MAG: cation:proton antiporter [Hadesarchaea archaeon DG-33-1]|nr:MAG: cation:proton antiporter [Hadesarchaea archaeon DG-33-1]
MIIPGIVIVLAGACLFCLLRAALGPTAPDRVIAIDALTSIIVACLVLLGVFYRTSFYLDVALVYAFLAFLGTIAISKYLEGRGLES